MVGITLCAAMERHEVNRLITASTSVFLWSLEDGVFVNNRSAEDYNIVGQNQTLIGITLFLGSLCIVQLLLFL